MKTAEEVSAVNILMIKLEEARQRNPRLSMRAFAQKLGVSSGAFSEILQGKRALSHQLKKKVAPKLNLTPDEELQFFREDLPAQLAPKRQEYMKLTSDQFHLISDWWHFALLNLVKTKSFRPQFAWMAERLGLSVQVVGDAWDRLFRLGHLKKGVGHRVERAHPRINTSDDFFDLSIQKAHLQDLTLIEHAILEVPIHLRNQTSYTLVMNKSDIPKAKELINIFQDQFAQKLAKDPGEEVYRLSISLFPLTQVLEEQ